MPNRSGQTNAQLGRRRIAFMFGKRDLRKEAAAMSQGPNLKEVPGTAAHFREPVRGKER